MSVVATAAPAVAQTTPAGTETRLSNETTFTRWANAAMPAKAYAQPTATARRVGRLRLLTEDGYPEVYPLLARREDAAGFTWVRLRLPQRPNGVTGWVRRSVLGPFTVVTKRQPTSAVIGYSARNRRAVYPSRCRAGALVCPNARA